jgi:glutamate N-acetyltransferase/amino-acid N-acetyltransferase
MRIPQGFLFSGINCGIKKKGLDLGLIWCKEGARGIGFFTKNVNPSYSVIVSKKHINNIINAVIVNSGSANCFTTIQDLKNTQRLCDRLAGQLNIKKGNVLIASTGRIGVRLPFSKVIKSLPHLCKNLNKDYTRFAQSILTTDTFIKTSFRIVKLKDKEVIIAGFSKGAGMISPDLATMLAFILTDARITKPCLREISQEAIERSFNSISVDGCMSTNDSVFVLSSGKSSQIRDKKSLAKFKRAMEEVCCDLAKMIVKDAEGSTKLVQIFIKGARSRQEAKRAFEIITSSVLFRSTLYGENPNWGRVISALGQAKIRIREDKFKVRASSLKKKEVKIKINLGRGRFSWQGWCSDATPQYIKINARYN